MQYDFDFYPECVKGVIHIKERKKLLKEFIQQQDEDYILALYDKMYSRVTDLRIEQNITQALKNKAEGLENMITSLKATIDKYEGCNIIK